MQVWLRIVEELLNSARVILDGRTVSRALFPLNTQEAKRVKKPPSRWRVRKNDLTSGAGGLPSPEKYKNERRGEEGYEIWMPGGA